jgi:hypothetical protein
MLRQPLFTIETGKDINQVISILPNSLKCIYINGGDDDDYDND